MTPQELKHSIIYTALQGRLVQQDGTDAPVDLRSIKQKKTEELEFDIPESWSIAHLETVTNGIPSKQYQILESEVLQAGEYPVISQSKAYTIGFSNNADKVYHHTNPVIVFGDHTTEVKYVDFDFIVGADGVKIFEPLDRILTARFLFYVFLFYSKDLNKVGVYSRHYKFIKNKPIPLPPLGEQKRIVARIEELLPLIDRYEQAWSKLEIFNKRFPVDMQKSILQMAIQGKLVEQRPEEGTGEELYRQIQAEKQVLVKAGKIKKEKPLPVIAEDEIPFDIPENWKWVSVGSVCANIQYGSSQKSAPSGKMAVLRMGNIQNGRLVLDKLVFTSDDDEIKKYPLQYDDLLFNRTNSKDLVGKTAIYKGEIPAIYAGYLVRITPLLMSSDYLNYVMQSQFYWSYCQTVRSDAIGQSNINAEKLKHFIFPLPPLAEQKRIVTKLEEILPLCERLKRG